MNIIMPTLYSNSRGGSVKILLKSAEALKREHNIVIRANIPEATEKTAFLMPDVLDSTRKKIAALLLIAKAIILESVYLKKKNIDVIYVHDELALYVYGLVAKIIGCKLVWHLHAQEGSNIKWFFRDWLSDYKIYISKHSQKRFSDHSYIVYNPLMVDSKQRNGKGDHRNSVNISVIGSISDNKNQFLGLEIIKRLKEISDIKFILNIYGQASNENYLHKLQEHIDRKGLCSDVIFHGYMDKQIIYEHTDIVLSTSKFESFGLVLIEAISRGIPVVVRNIDASREIFDLIEYQREMLFNDINEACRAILSGLNMDMKHYPEKVKEIFSSEKFSNELLKIFKEIEKHED